jgi:peptidoglycan hydrolase-like protein with peptidoglycan-binding domain
MLRVFWPLLCASFIWTCNGAALRAQHSQHQVSYEQIQFLGDQSANDRSWTRLGFRIDGFIIDGLCYHSCDIEFSIDGATSGLNSNRADVRVTRQLVTSNFPTDFYGQMFIGNRTARDFEIAAIEDFRDREKIAIAWIIENSNELIRFALDTGRIDASVVGYWEFQSIRFERRLREAFATTLSGYQNSTEQRNSIDNTRRIIQPALAQLGKYSGPLDGIPRREVRQGIEDVQRQQGRLVTGYADEELRTWFSEILTNEDILAPLPELTYTQRLADRLGVELSDNDELESIALDATLELTRLEAEVLRLQNALDVSRSVAARRLETIRTLRQQLENHQSEQANSTPSEFGWESIGPAQYSTAYPGWLFLIGEINDGDQTVVNNAIREKNIQVVVLNSPGGVLSASLDLAESLREQRISTYVPRGAECASACVFIFLGGESRLAEGALRVHQLRARLEEGATYSVDVDEILRGSLDFTYRILTLGAPSWLLERLNSSPSLVTLSEGENSELSENASFVRNQAGFSEIEPLVARLR